MDKKEFFCEIERNIEELGITLNEKQKEDFYIYMNLLISWNEKINLTAITEPKDVIIKHFIDSLTIFKALEPGKTIIDVGTGAGFPGIPIKIYDEMAKVTLLDSLNKRIIYLNDVIQKLEIKNIESIHGRVEEIANKKEYRQKYDVATSRAVAALNILVEYLLPLVKVGGKCICMKGPEIQDELKNSENAIKILGGKLEQVINFKLPNTDFERNLIIIKKIKDTPNIYPRKPGTPSKEPL